MSFSDIGKRRLNTGREPQSSIAKHQARRAPPTLRYFYGDSNDQATLDRNKQLKKDLAISSQPPQRGVRPRLSHVCPVTEKPLMEVESMRDDDTTTVTSCSYGIDDANDDDSFPAPVNRALPRQAGSEFALLNKEIVNFQKMVADLDQAMEKSADSPEAQWKTRIFLRSAQEAQQDIQNRLLDFGDNNRRHNDSRGQMALRKLRRDFARVRDNFTEVTQSHMRKQQAEVSLFRSALAEEGKEEEEFFDRAMREREQEVTNIHQSMKTVNAIYNDLAEIVDGQQERIDKLADRVEESKSNTKYGLEQIQDAVMGMCAPMEAGDSGDHPWSDAIDDILEMTTSCKTKVEKGLCASNDDMMYE